MIISSYLRELLDGKLLLIFDFDGTVADTTSLHASAFESVLVPLGVTVHYSSIAGLNTKDAIRYCFREAGKVVDDDQLVKLVLAKQNTVRKLMLKNLEPMPGINEFLQLVKDRYTCCIASSGSRDTVSFALEKLGYREIFQPVICSSDVSRTKPFPDLFLKALELTNIARQKALVFEDSIAGFMAAKSAHISYINIRDCFDEGD